MDVLRVSKSEISIQELKGFRGEDGEPVEAVAVEDVFSGADVSCLEGVSG